MVLTWNILPDIDAAIPQLVNDTTGRQQFMRLNNDSFDKHAGLDLLFNTISHVGAFHSSEERFPPPKCYPDTRIDVLQELSHWITSNSWKRFVNHLIHPRSRDRSSSVISNRSAGSSSSAPTSPTSPGSC
ncbi:hypothetical protein K435DRAFT_853026 [Dendrothele bispora CBS 962.96]|uniref:Uncharacterized protein n=1 Tax=Dendrothele bispora (strain CBS 962.96) TaxID=1314807 RepID=A0A4S8MHQ3_DENBC|nr:hypothetical protein K435DRAFT_853026 [Dendrothele bispora CBS 962.96]